MKKLACIKWNFASKMTQKQPENEKIKIGMRKNIICHVNYNHVQNGTIPKYVLEPHRITRKLFLNMHDFFVEMSFLGLKCLFWPRKWLKSVTFGIDQLRKCPQNFGQKLWRYDDVTTLSQFKNFKNFEIFNANDGILEFLSHWKQPSWG